MNSLSFYCLVRSAGFTLACNVRMEDDHMNVDDTCHGDDEDEDNDNEDCDGAPQLRQASHIAPDLLAAASLNDMSSMMSHGKKVYLKY